jgi:hypothetical protein
VSDEAKAYLEEAMRRTGLTDFGSGALEEPLERLLRSVHDESRLTELGRGALHGGIMSRLVTRLQVEACYAGAPEIDDEEIHDMVFVVGLPRTGSTVLGQLLALHPETRYLRRWEAAEPCPPPDATAPDDARIAQTAARIEHFERVVPRHSELLPRSGPNDVEEDSLLLECSFVSPAWEAAFRCPSYMDWLLSDESNIREGFQYHRRILKLLQWKWPAKRWMLRAPTHTLTIDALDDAYPDARYVWTHRDPLAVITSVCSLVTMVREAFVSNPEPAELGPILGRNWAQGVTQAMRFRDRIGEDRFLDVAHGEQLRDPLATVAHVHQWLGWPMSPSVEADVSRWREEKPKGVHRPDPAAYGIEPLDLRDRFAEYTERFAPFIG